MLTNSSVESANTSTAEGSPSLEQIKSASREKANSATETLLAGLEKIKQATTTAVEYIHNLFEAANAVSEDTDRKWKNGEMWHEITGKTATLERDLKKIEEMSPVGVYRSLVKGPNQIQEFRNPFNEATSDVEAALYTREYWQTIEDTGTLSNRSARTATEQGVSTERFNAQLAREFPTRIKESYKRACELDVQVERAILEGRDAAEIISLGRERDKSMNLAFILKAKTQGEDVPKVSKIILEEHWSGEGTTAYINGIENLVIDLENKLAQTKEPQTQQNIKIEIGRLRARSREAAGNYSRGKALTEDIRRRELYEFPQREVNEAIRSFIGSTPSSEVDIKHLEWLESPAGTRAVERAKNLIDSLAEKTDNDSIKIDDKVVLRSNTLIREHKALETIKKAKLL